MARSLSLPLRRLLVGGAAAAWAGLGAFTLVIGWMLASPLVAILASAGLVVGAVMVFRPELALIVTSLVIPLERIGRFGSDESLQSLSLMRLIGIIALLAVVVMMLRRRLLPIIDLPACLYGAYCLLGFLSYLYAHDPAVTAAHAATNLGNLLFLILIVNGVRDRHTMKPMIVAWLVSTILVALYQVYDWHFGQVVSDLDFGKAEHRFAATLDTISEEGTLGVARRAMGTTSNPAVYGINLLLSLPFFLYLIRFSRSPILLLFWSSATLLILYNIFLTNTRAVMILAAVLVALAVLTGLLRITVTRIWAGLVGLTIVFLVTPENVYHRALSLEAYAPEKATNFIARLDLWSAALRLGSEQWMTGIGVGNRTRILDYLDSKNAEAPWIMAHNEFLQLFIELGLPGVVLFAAFLVVLLAYGVSALKSARRTGDREGEMFLVAALLALVGGIAFAQQVDAFHFPLKGWWLTAGLVSVLYRLRDRSPAPAPGAWSRPHVDAWGRNSAWVVDESWRADRVIDFEGGDKARQSHDEGG